MSPTINYKTLGRNNLIYKCDFSAGSTTPHPASNKPVTTPMEEDPGLFDIKPKIEPNRPMDYDDSKIDDDLDKLLQHIKEEQQNSLVSYFYCQFVHF